jgi:hypothetical protein
MSKSLIPADNKFHIACKLAWAFIAIGVLK